MDWKRPSNTRPGSRRQAAGLPITPPGTVAELAELVAMFLGSKEAVALETSETIDTIEGKIRHLAEDVLKCLRDAQQGPSFGEAMDRLDEVRRLSLELQRKLGAMDSLSLSVFTGKLEWMRRPVLLDGTPPKPAPAAAVAIEIVNSREVIKPLKALARAAEMTREFMEGRETTVYTPRAAQGGGNMLSRLVGDIRVHLVKECAQFIGAAQGAAAVTGAENGKLHRFAVALWTYTTGLDIEESGGSEMIRIVKRVAKEVRPIIQARDDAAATGGRRFPPEVVVAEMEMEARLRQPTRITKRRRQDPKL